MMTMVAAMAATVVEQKQQENIMENALDSWHATTWLDQMVISVMALWSLTISMEIGAVQ